LDEPSTTDPLIRVRITVPGEHPVRITVYVVPDPLGEPIVQVEYPVPDRVKSELVNPVTEESKTRLYVSVVELLVVDVGAKVVTFGPLVEKITVRV